MAVTAGGAPGTEWVETRGAAQARLQHRVISGTSTVPRLRDLLTEPSVLVWIKRDMCSLCPERCPVPSKPPAESGLGESERRPGCFVSNKDTEVQGRDVLAQNWTRPRPPPPPPFTLKKVPGRPGPTEP